MRLFSLFLMASICSIAGAASNEGGARVELHGIDTAELITGLQQSSSQAVRKTVQSDVTVLQTRAPIRCSYTNVTHRSECRLFPGQFSLLTLYPTIADALHPERVLNKSIVLRDRSASHLALEMVKVAAQKHSGVNISDWINYNSGSFAYSVGQKVGLNIDANKATVQCVIHAHASADCAVNFQTQTNPLTGERE